MIYIKTGIVLVDIAEAELVSKNLSIVGIAVNNLYFFKKKN